MGFKSNMTNSAYTYNYKWLGKNGNNVTALWNYAVPGFWTAVRQIMLFLSEVQDKGDNK